MGETKLFLESNFLASISTCLLWFSVTMSLSYCKNGSNTPRLHNHLHSLHIAENYAKRPVRTFLDFRDTNVAENLDIKHVPMLFFKNLQRISKIKVVSFLLGLTLTFFIMASYVLMWDKKGPLFTPSPYQLRPAAIPTSTTATRASSKKNPVNVKVLVKLIKQEYTPRKVPDEKDVIATDSHVSLLQIFTTRAFTVNAPDYCHKQRQHRSDNWIYFLSVFLFVGKNEL